MGTIRDLAYAGATAAFRKWVTNGVPASGVHKPDKDEEIPALFAEIEDRIAVVEATAGGDLISEAGYATVAAMQAALASHDNGSVVAVLADPLGDVTNGNGFWLRVAGAWVWQRKFNNLRERAAAAATVSYTLAILRTRSSNAINTIAATTDTTPVQYYIKRHASAACWDPVTEADV